MNVSTKYALQCSALTLGLWTAAGGLLYKASQQPPMPDVPPLVAELTEINMRKMPINIEDVLDFSVIAQQHRDIDRRVEILRDPGYAQQQREYMQAQRDSSTGGAIGLALLLVVASVPTAAAAGASIPTRNNSVRYARN